MNSTSTSTTTRPAPKFKVGDKVRINANGPRLYWVHKMDNFKTTNVVGIINQDIQYDEIHGSYLYKLIAYEGYCISEQDFEIVEETKVNINAHPHADLIIAWVNGAKIEYYDYIDEKWYRTNRPSWSESQVYRIKPEELMVVPKVFFMSIQGDISNENNIDIKVTDLGRSKRSPNINYNVKATVDKNTGKLLSIEMI